MYKHVKEVRCKTLGCMVEFITVGRMVVCVLIMDDINTTMPPLDVEIEFV